jgi:hypothetical protein
MKISSFCERRDDLADALGAQFSVGDAEHPPELSHLLEINFFLLPA